MNTTARAVVYAKWKALGGPDTLQQAWPDEPAPLPELPPWFRPADWLRFDAVAEGVWTGWADFTIGRARIGTDDRGTEVTARDLLCGVVELPGGRLTRGYLRAGELPLTDRPTGGPPAPGRVASNAHISPCGRYRYWLTRDWDDAAQPATFIMLNPSTADAMTDDPTVRRCVSFARRWGCGGIRVVNLFALRATDPGLLYEANDPVGGENDHWLVDAATAGGPVIAAWGTHGGYRERDAWVVRLLANVGVHPRCLGLTRDGHPRHPLYVRADAPLVAYPGPPDPQLARSRRARR